MQRCCLRRVLRALSLRSSAVYWTDLRQPSSSGTLRGPSRSIRSWYSTSSVLRFPVVQFPLAQTGEGIAECELIKWLVKKGDRIQRFDKVCEVQSDKASIEISSPYEGTVTSLPHKVGDIIKVGSTLMEIDVDQDTSAEITSPPSEAALQKSDTPGEEKARQDREPKKPVLAAPPVRSLAKEKHIDLADVPSTGPGGRVTKEDVLKYIAMDREPSTPKHIGEEKRIPIKGIRRSMLKNMTASMTIPHFHFTDDVDVTSLLTMKSNIADEPRLRGLSFTLLPILVKALSAVLLEFPEINCSLSEDHSEIIVHRAHHIGIAMAMDTGLVVPVMKNVQQKTIVDIAHELYSLKSTAASDCLKPEDLQGATITISNIGSMGGIYATPLIVPPQTAIVAIGRMRPVVRVKDSKDVSGHLTDLKACPMMPISWGADHRVLDGANLVEFSNRWKQFLERPERLLVFLK